MNCWKWHVWFIAHCSFESVCKLKCYGQDDYNWGLFYFKERKKINRFLWLLDLDDFGGCFWFLSQPAAGCLMPFPCKGKLVSGRRAPALTPLQWDSKGAAQTQGFGRQIDLVGQKITLLPWCGVRQLDKFSAFSGISVGLQLVSFLPLIAWICQHIGAEE